MRKGQKFLTFFEWIPKTLDDTSAINRVNDTREAHKRALWRDEWRSVTLLFIGQKWVRYIVFLWMDADYEMDMLIWLTKFIQPIYYIIYIHDCSLIFVNQDEIYDAVCRLTKFSSTNILYYIFYGLLTYFCQPRWKLFCRVNTIERVFPLLGKI